MNMDWPTAAVLITTMIVIGLITIAELANRRK